MSTGSNNTNSHKRRLLPKRIGGAVYLLPNLLTTGNLFFGYFSIIKSLQGQFLVAAGAILLASIFDILDGRVARLTNATSEFGVQYDSLCDLVSFGLAPAFMVYQYALKDFGRIGWIVCFIYLACGALRLAKFNVLSALGKASGDFVGTPIPVPAGTIACFIAFLEDFGDGPDRDFWLITKIQEFFLDNSVFKSYFLLSMTFVLALLMVSNISYRSHKSINIKILKPFRLLALSVMTIGFIAYKPAFAGFILYGTYVLSGLFELVMGWKKAADDDEIFESIPDEGSIMEPNENGK